MIKPEYDRHTPKRQRVAGSARAPTSRDKARRRSALEAALDASHAQALRTTHDLGALYQQEKQRRHDLEAAYAQQVRLVADWKAAFRAEQTGRRALSAVYLQTLDLLARAVEVRDDYTGGHVERVRAYSLAIADVLALDAAAQRDLEMGAVLHDVGKIGIPDAILGKPAPLTADEHREMRTHPEKGAALLREVTFLAPALAGVETHHERWDGRGYPHGLRGQAIPLLGRIVAVADAFDAMTTDRPYRQALAEPVALAELEAQRGLHFDPQVVGAFVQAWHTGRIAAGLKPPPAASTTKESRA